MLSFLYCMLKRFHYGKRRRVLCCHGCITVSAALFKAYTCKKKKRHAVRENMNLPAWRNERRKRYPSSRFWLKPLLNIRSGRMKLTLSLWVEITMFLPLFFCYHLFLSRLHPVNRRVFGVWKKENWMRSGETAEKEAEYKNSVKSVKSRETKKCFTFSVCSCLYPCTYDVYFSHNSRITIPFSEFRKEWHHIYICPSIVCFIYYILFIYLYFFQRLSVFISS